ncbi:MAG: hypothetical protein A3A94_01505 [Candidatus Portnoybacteria bacterium RIFCSPLOWO2_01_FULL_43_11]|uniref:DUF3352 domain-containing protein n=4 Tax=Candidatus Portnoyibacteriota TaxID=1817913 RepID=A0A1G2FB02_9BACT|nr:MAG: hypothetical protein A2815_02740 [Candidatus Portnoybacteria bacterium RIFCSPHIGHO2_01_FULL_40_12b]OGZ37234.1 MAG: hypothetical protein A3D38_01730 [Candidatus Portnoybacteria bacterium RIFCSPHIGHO2_02_FULL_40_23]OGZ38008.1 MAG: hypothetical protein A3A94_01505 [Candidatus Portnoybacteria bacterium RIFCSPLOWO2_01_FULL_43_11]OGZ38488.1 MAG: hypothetical protein A3E90_00460 [Candidatus Portnoybacteria bacterium RIFCSPHIGHO2_12_FULL_40_11]OGZ40901.1 MAG: hypothetical protein A3I20_01640 [C
MVKIPIKIKKDNSLKEKVSDELKVDLRKSNESGIKAPGLPPLFKKTAGWVLLVLIGAALFYGVNRFLNPAENSSLIKIIPKSASAFVIIDQKSLFDQILPFHQEFLEQSSFYQWSTKEFEKRLNQAGLDFPKDIQPLLKNQVGLALFPQKDKEPFPFVLILQREATSAQTNRILEQIEKELEKDFHTSYQTYRQNKIINLKSLSSQAKNYYYSQIEDYFLISNSPGLLEKTIDLIIKQ